MRQLLVALVAGLAAVVDDAGVAGMVRSTHDVGLGLADSGSLEAGVVRATKGTPGSTSSVLERETSAETSVETSAERLSVDPRGFRNGIGDSGDSGTSYDTLGDSKDSVHAFDGAADLPEGGALQFDPRKVCVAKKGPWDAGFRSESPVTDEDSSGSDAEEDSAEDCAAVVFSVDPPDDPDELSKKTARCLELDCDYRPGAWQLLGEAGQRLDADAFTWAAGSSRTPGRAVRRPRCEVFEAWRGCCGPADGGGQDWDAPAAKACGYLDEHGAFQQLEVGTKCEVGTTALFCTDPATGISFM